VNGIGSNLILITDEVYKNSYAYRYAQAYVDSALGQGRIDPFYALPLPPDMDTNENHSLFHYYFSYEIQQGIQTPKPPEFAANLLLSPFFFPAMGDTTVCLSTLANAAAMFPTNQGLPPDRVRSMEFTDRAMSALRDQTIVENPPSDNAIIAQAFLWVVSLNILDKPGMLGYANSVHALVRARGGIRQLGMQGIIEQFVRFVDCRHGLQSHTASTYQDAPEPPALPQVPARKYGSFWDTEQVVNASILSQDVLEACRGVCRMIELAEDFSTSGVTTPRYMWLLGKALHSSTARSRALERYESTGTFNELVISANELALQFALDNPFRKENAVLCQSIPLVRAMQEIDKHYPSLLAFPHRESDLLLWVLFLIAMVPHKFKGKDWAFEQVCRVIRNTLAKTGELPSDWTDQILRKFAQFTWSDLKMRRIFDATFQAIRKNILLDRHGT
jgi:hypothetical protein